jgi:iron complex outermembrane receptor protein
MIKCKLSRSVSQALLLGGCVLVTPCLALASEGPSPLPGPSSGMAGAIGQNAQASADAETDKASDKDRKSKKPVKLKEIVVVGNTVNKLAPSAAPLDAIQPTSVMDERFIRDALRSDANYSDIIKYSPSVTVTSPEGPGLGKMEGTSIRGFQDGQFNITFDGIPFGNQADLHHTTSAYFTNHVLGQAQIDRGPGGAATVGNATFGGTVGLRSRDPEAVSGITPYIAVGSWNYLGEGVSASSGLGDRTRIFADVSKSSAETYLKGTDDRAKHAFVKTVTQLAPTVKMTFVTSYNEERQNTTQGSSPAQVEQFGWRFGLGDDPSVQNFKWFNRASYYSSFTYLGLSASVGNWDIDNKAYYVTFNHASHKAKDATDIDPANNGVTFYDANGKKAGTIKDDVSGKRADSHYHAVGDVLRLDRYFGASVFKVGVWAERDVGGQFSIPMDLTTEQITGYKYGSMYQYLYTETDKTVQPYAEFDWALNDWLTLTPGLKYTETTRQQNAAYGKEDPYAGKPFSAKAKYDATLPSLSLHASFTDHWAGYAQYAKGFLSPPIDVIEVNGSKDLKPELTTNFQVGTAYATRELTFGADIYYIDFTNMLTQTEVSTDLGNEPTFINGGGAIYKGVEFEATFAITRTLSLYVNGSKNTATYRHTSVQIAQTPKLTGALGVLYSGERGFYWSVMSKFTGSQYGVDNTTDDDGNTVFGNSVRMGGFTAVDATIGYRTQQGGFANKGWAIALNVNNIFDVHKRSVYAGTQKVSGDPLFFGLAGRGLFLDVSMKF